MADYTYPCEYLGCFYNEDGRCVYSKAKIQIPRARACYEELQQDYYEALADYELGLF